MHNIYRYTLFSDRWLLQKKKENKKSDCNPSCRSVAPSLRKKSDGVSVTYVLKICNIRRTEISDNH